jgi:hypothetical protein
MYINICIFVYISLCLFYVILHSFIYIYIYLFNVCLFLGSRRFPYFCIYISFLKGPEPLWVQPSSIFSGIGSPSWGQGDRSLWLTTDLHLVSRLQIRGDTSICFIPLQSIWTAFPFFIFSTCLSLYSALWSL